MSKLEMSMLLAIVGRTRWFLVRQKFLRHVKAERTPTMLIVANTSSRMSIIYERTVPVMETSAAVATNG